jgi:hypothetical protein
MERDGSGWVVFASIVLGIAGIMRLFDSIWAFNYNGALPQNFNGAVFGHNMNTYGWLWLIVAVIYIGCALALLNGSQLARWVGVAAAAIGTFSAIWWMPYYPVWSFVYVVIGIMVIYGLVAYGGRSTVEA